MTKRINSNDAARGVLFLTVSTIIVKFAGLLFKIPLTALIGESGMGYFNSAYTLFTWFYMISTAGLPVAAAMMISSAKAEGKRRLIRRIFRLTLVVFIGFGLVGSGIMAFGAGWFSSLMKVGKSRLSMLAIAPTLFLICQSAALRGYFQGLGELVPHALSQIAEALGKLFLGLALAKYALSKGEPIEVAAAYAAFGLTVGVGAGMVVLYLSLLFVKNDEGDLNDVCSERLGSLLRRLFSAALPITLSAGLSSLSGLLDGFLMTRGLHSLGLSQLESAAVWGNYSSLALPMFNLPPVLIYPLVYALTPELTALLASNDICGARKRCKRTFSLTAALAIPCSLGLAALAEPILALFYDAKLAERGAEMLILLAPASFLVCLLAVTNTVLQVCGRGRDTLYAMALGVLTKLVSAWILIPRIGKLGTPISTFLCYFVCVGLSLIFIDFTPLAGLFTPKLCALWAVGSCLSVTLAVMVFPRLGVLPAMLAAIVSYALICGRRILKILKGN